jgi:hypothetical protein
LQPKDNADVGIINGQIIGVHESKHEKVELKHKPISNRRKESLNPNIKESKKKQT